MRCLDLDTFGSVPAALDLPRCRDLYTDLGGRAARDPDLALIWNMTRNRPTANLARRLAAVPASALLLLAACSGDDDSAEPTTSTSRRASTTSSVDVTTTTTPDPDAALTAAVQSFWDLYLEVGGRSDTFDAEQTRQQLAERTTGRELERLLEYFQGNALAGYVVRGDVDIAPTVVSNDGTTATVRDCYDDRTGVYRVSDNTRVDTEDPRRHQVVMTFVLEDGTWKVEAVADEADGCTV